MGIILILLGLCGTLPMMYLVGQAPVRGGVGGMTTAFPVVFVLVFALFYFGPGVCYVVFASYLSNYRRWAVTATLVVTALTTLLFLLGGIGLGFTVIRMQSFDPTALIPLGIVVVFLLGLAQMLYHLILSYEAVKLPPFGREMVSGFTPIFPTGTMNAGNVSPPPPQHLPGA